MVVTRLGCQNFRNLRDGELFPCPGVNVIYGGNAQGKTNLLEGLWLFTGGHSFRGAKDVELPRLDTATGENAPTAALALDYFSEGREQKALLQFENGRRSSVINGVRKKTGSALVGKVCAVIFSPEHLLLVKEGPARRRAFLDGAWGRMEGDVLTVVCASDFTMNQLHNVKVQSVLQSVTSDHLGLPVSVHFTVGELEKPAVSEPAEDKLKDLIDLGSQFDNFTVK